MMRYLWVVVLSVPTLVPNARAADAPPASALRIVGALTSGKPQGGGADPVLGPGNRVWGFTGAYGCGGVWIGKTTPERSPDST